MENKGFGGVLEGFNGSFGIFVDLEFGKELGRNLEMGLEFLYLRLKG